MPDSRAIDVPDTLKSPRPTASAMSSARSDSTREAMRSMTGAKNDKTKITMT